MHISNAQVHMQSAYLYHQEKSEQINIESRQGSLNTAQPLNDIVDISQRALNELRTTPLDGTDSVDVNSLDELSLQVSILKQIVEYFTGKKLIFADINGYSENNVNTNSMGSNSSSQSPLNLVTSVSIDIKRHYEEREVSAFSAQAIVNTKGGRQLTIDLSLTQSRSFSVDEQISIRTGEFKDPLVLNFFANGASLINDRYKFDIDADGIDDSVPILSNGSAYLALDKNNDGTINDGSELFGTISGDGFADLVKFDDDNNGWIDESDAIFSKLKLWSKSSDTELFLNLTDKNIGAIYLGNVTTPFQLVDESMQNTLGLTKSTGLYLNEMGEAKTIQQIDVST